MNILYYTPTSTHFKYNPSQNSIGIMKHETLSNVANSQSPDDAAISSLEIVVS